jgi:hypothetical protein
MNVPEKIINRPGYQILADGTLLWYGKGMPERVRIAYTFDAHGNIDPKSLRLINADDEKALEYFNLKPRKAIRDINALISLALKPTPQDRGR